MTALSPALWLLRAPPSCALPPDERTATLDLPSGSYDLPSWYGHREVSLLAEALRWLSPTPLSVLSLPEQALRRPGLALVPAPHAPRLALLLRLEDPRGPSDHTAAVLARSKCDFVLRWNLTPKTSPVWLEREIKPQLLWAFTSALRDPTHPLAPFEPHNLDLTEAAFLTGDPVEWLILLETTFAHRLTYADATSPSDYLRSLRQAHPQRLGARLSLLPPEDLARALDLLLELPQQPEPDRLRAQAALVLHDLAFGEGRDFFLGPLARDLTDDYGFWATLRDATPHDAWSPAALAALHAKAPREPASALSLSNYAPITYAGDPPLADHLKPLLPDPTPPTLAEAHRLLHTLEDNGWAPPGHAIFASLPDLLRRLQALQDDPNTAHLAALLTASLHLASARHPDDLPRAQEAIHTLERIAPDDLRLQAFALGYLANALERAVKLDDALALLQDKLLPTFEQLGDVHLRAFTMGQIADILQARGKLDDALRIRQQEELPVYESLGDLRSGAVTMGQIANILERLGKLDEAIAMRRESNTACERFGNAHDLLMGRANLAVSLAMRGRQEDKAEVEALLKAAHRAAMGMKIPEARWIEGLIKQHVQKPKANKYSQGLPTKKRRK